MKKPKNAQKRQATQKRATKRTVRSKKIQSTKHARNEEKKQQKISAEKKFNTYLNNLLGEEQPNQPIE